MRKRGVRIQYKGLCDCHGSVIRAETDEPRIKEERPKGRNINEKTQTESGGMNMWRRRYDNEDAEGKNSNKTTR